MLTRPADLPDSAIAAALAAGWDLVVDEIEYAAVGFGSHHWRVVAGNERWFVTVDDLDARLRDSGDGREDVAARLTAALDTARALRHDGLDFVIAPRSTRSSDVAYRVDDRYVAALYEHIDGGTHDWGVYATRDDRLAVLDRLVVLHRTTATVREVALTDDFTLPNRGQLTIALTDTRTPWGPGPFAADAEQLLRQHAPDVTAAFDRYDALVAEVESMSARFVITHGEPHRANTINTANGVALIDWDTTLLAPPERDLWMLIDEESGIAEDYTARIGVAVSASAVQLYRLGWDLCEIALYTTEFRAPHTGSEDVRQAWEGLREYLDPKRWVTER